MSLEINGLLTYVGLNGLIGVRVFIPPILTLVHWQGSAYGRTISRCRVRLFPVQPHRYDPEQTGCVL